jgi:2,3-bisphosphoglycerate-independent phosphoglycerate mutase
MFINKLRKNRLSKKTVLIITDGIGHNTNKEYNAFANASTPTYDWMFENVPNSLIKTSGLSVGLPEGQMGNSEVGHMCIGSGRILYQDLVKINMAVKDNNLKNNKAISNLIDTSNNIHLIGLLSDGGVHSHIDHIINLAQNISKNKKVFLHLITDGRDVAPKSAISFIEKIEKILNENIKIASIGGRFYTMDRDNRWERIKKGYDAIINAKNTTHLTVKEYINASYIDEVTDEFIVPTSFEEYNGICENDGIIFCNFRSDRMRQIVNATGNQDFKEFQRNDKNINIVTMTQYDKNFTFDIAYPKEAPKNTLAQVISDNNLTQLHTSETEKYAHVTFFLNGGIEEPFENETRILVPSPAVKTYDEQPQMSAKEISNIIQTAIKDDYSFIVANFANGDMVGHTGVYEAGIKAVESVDTELGKIIKLAKEKDYNVVITSDHGNCEKMKDENGNILTNHTVGDVYGFVISDKVKSIKDGGLDNIAPTVLKLMELEIPSQMSEALY